MENFMVGIHDWNDQVVEVPMGTLIAWKGALKLEAAGMKHSRGSVATHVRTVLSVPDGNMSVSELADYISRTVADINNQLAG